MTIRERIIQYIDSKGISKYKFYKQINVANGFLDKKGTIGADKCEQISYHYPDLNLKWLLTGKGEMLLKNNNDNTSGGTYEYDEDEREIHRVAEPAAGYGRAVSIKEHCPFEPVCEMKKNRVFFEGSNSLTKELSINREYQNKYVTLLESYNTMLILFSKAHMKLMHLYFYARQHDDAKKSIDLKVAEKLLHDMDEAEARLQHI